MFVPVFNQIYINQIQIFFRCFNYYGLPQADLNTASNSIDYRLFFKYFRTPISIDILPDFLKNLLVYLVFFHL